MRDDLARHRDALDALRAEARRIRDHAQTCRKRARMNATVYEEAGFPRVSDYFRAEQFQHIREGVSAHKAAEHIYDAIRSIDRALEALGADL